ncbi:MAG TPA: hypothetical protein VGY48_16310 [Vicinamibacterales bacterium]|jgi:hypothetical protein|nr:hypothetical protein [Vicinamibacterales bacterium]
MGRRSVAVRQLNGRLPLTVLAVFVGSGMYSLAAGQDGIVYLSDGHPDLLIRQANYSMELILRGARSQEKQ